MLKFIKVFHEFPTTKTYFLNQFVPPICFLFLFSSASTFYLVIHKRIEKSFRTRVLGNFDDRKSATVIRKSYALPKYIGKILIYKNREK